MASILARTCLRGNHLWEDFGLGNRSEITALMRRNFPRLAALNADGRMRWKKFFYRQLCQRAEILICRSPNCQSCDEYQDCFPAQQSGLEQADGVVWARMRVA
jgi:nitrogen fixation protein NifQ